jgi:hypothetical protein
MSQEKVSAGAPAGAEARKALRSASIPKSGS